MQLVDLADSALSGKIQHIPDNMYDLDADWEIDPKSLTLMEKIGDFQRLPSCLLTLIMAFECPLSTCIDQYSQSTLHSERLGHDVAAG